MASQVYPQRIFDSLMITRYKQGHPESKVVAIHWFDNPYGQPNTVPRGIDHMASQGLYFRYGPRINHCQFMVWWSACQPRTQNKLLTRCRSGLHKQLAIMESFVLISINEMLSHVDWRMSFYRSPSSKTAWVAQFEEKVTSRTMVLFPKLCPGTSSPQRTRRSPFHLTPPP